MTNYWVVIAPKDHVVSGMRGGFAQTGHGKAHPLRRMGVGDGVICYSPKLEFGARDPYQRFTAIGTVVGPEVYRADLGNNIQPYRREVRYFSSRDLPIAPLISRLNFIKDKERWGNIFKFGIIRIPREDFMLIASNMSVAGVL